MAFPVVGATNESATTSAGTSHTINLPSGIVAGNLLLVMLGKGTTSATINALAGWTELLDEAQASGCYIAYRWADGTEGASITLTSSASTKSASVSYLISGAVNPATQAPQVSAVATGSSQAPDPNSLTPTGGAKDYLWLTFFILGGAGEEADDDTWCNNAATNYSGLLQKTSGTAGANIGAYIASCQRTANAASEDAIWPAGSTDVSLPWRAFTIAVHPDPTRRAFMSWTELETPNAPRRARMSWAEFETPNGPRRAWVSWSELEVPLAPRRAWASWTELEVPTAPRRAFVSWGEVETPTAPRRADVSWAELEVPSPPLGQRCQISWAELQTPNAPRRTYVSWSELQTPDGPRRCWVSWSELETPTAPRRATTSWAELEVPIAPRRGLVSWAECEIPNLVFRKATVSWAEMESPTLRRLYLQWAEFKIVRERSQTGSLYVITDPLSCSYREPTQGRQVRRLVFRVCDDGAATITLLDPGHGVGEIVIHLTAAQIVDIIKLIETDG